MAKRKSSRSKKRGSKIDWGAVARGGARFLAVLLLIAVGFGLTVGVDKMRARAAEALSTEERGGEPLEVVFNWPRLHAGTGEGERATWLPVEDQRALIDAVRWAAGEAEPLAVTPLRRVSRTLGATGWFVGDPVVRSAGPGRLEVTAVWRKPAAVVRWGRGSEARDILISDRAMRMPPEWSPGGSVRPVILGCSNPPPTDSSLTTRYGTPWDGQDIRAGLDLLRVLSSAGLLGEVSGVDVGAHWRAGPLEIVSKDGGRIVWGSAPDEWAEGEPSVAERVSRLRGLLERTGEIDGGERRIEIHREHVEIDRSVGGAGGDD